MAEVLGFTNAKGEVSFRDPESGEYVWVPKEEAQQAADAGLIPETREDAYQRKAYHPDSVPDALMTGAINALTLDGALLPEESGTQQYLAKASKLHREHSPVASQIGDIIGTTAGLAATGGFGGADLLAGKAIAQAGLKRLAARGALEGTAFAAHGSARKQIAEKQFNPAKLARDIGEGAIIGSALNLGLSGLGTLAGKTAGKIKSATERLKQSGRLAADKAAGSTELIARKTVLQEDLDTLRRLGGDDVLALTDEVSTLKQQIKQASKARKQAYKGARKQVGGYATPAQIARAREMSLNLNYPAALRKKINDVLIDPTAYKVRHMFAAVKGKELASPRLLAPAPEAIPAGLSKYVHNARRAVKDLRLSEDVRKEAQALLDKTATATHKTAKKEIKQQFENLLNQVDEQLGVPQLAQQADEFLKTVRAGKKINAAEQGLEVKTLKEQLKAAKAKLEAKIGDWKPKSGVNVGQLGGELKQVERALSQSRKANASKIGSALANTRNILALGGGLATQSWMVGLGGFAAAQALRSSVLKQAAGKAAQAIIGAGTKAIPAVKLAAIHQLTESDLDKLDRELKQQDPDQIFQETFDGVLAGGAQEKAASDIAHFASERVKLLREQLPKTRSQLDRQKASRLVAAVSDPRSIMARLKENRLTDEDLIALKRLFPELYTQLQKEAQAILANKERVKDQRARRTLKALTSGMVYSNTFTLLEKARGQQELPRARASRKVLKMPQMASNMQRIERKS